MSSEAAALAFRADLVDRYTTLVHQEKQRKTVRKKAEDLAAKEKKARLVMEHELKEAQIRNESLQTALDEAQKALAEHEKKLKNEVAFAQMTAADEYRSFAEFGENIIQLSRPDFKFGYTVGLQKAKAFHPELEEEMKLDDDKDYDSDIEDLAEQCLQGFKAGESLQAITKAFYAKRQAEIDAEEAAERVAEEA